MARKKTVVLVPITETRCGTCALLEKTVYEDSNGKIVEGYRCPLNRVLPPLIEPYFAEKCSLHKPKSE